MDIKMRSAISLVGLSGSHSVDFATLPHDRLIYPSALFGPGPMVDGTRETTAGDGKPDHPEGN